MVDTVTDLSTGDVLVVVLVLQLMQQYFCFVATSSTSNSGTANLTSTGGTIDVGNSTTGAYNLTGLSGDTLKGNSNNDTINAGSGNDTIDGRDGNDIINAGDGDDTIIVQVQVKVIVIPVDEVMERTLQLSSGSHTFSMMH